MPLRIRSRILCVAKKDGRPRNLYGNPTQISSYGGFGVKLCNSEGMISRKQIDE
jgi:hypothetical protein